MSHSSVTVWHCIHNLKKSQRVTAGAAIGSHRLATKVTAGHSAVVLVNREQAFSRFIIQGFRPTCFKWGPNVALCSGWSGPASSQRFSLFWAHMYASPDPSPFFCDGADAWSFQVPCGHSVSISSVSRLNCCTHHRPLPVGPKLSQNSLFSTLKLRRGVQLRAAESEEEVGDPFLPAACVMNVKIFNGKAPHASVCDAMTHSQEVETYEPITETMTRLAGISDAEERMKALREVFWRVDNEGMQLLASKVSE
eukprot:830017-Rhodomonas_salina.1